MKIPITKYGTPQVVVFPLIVAFLMVLAGFIVPSGLALVTTEAVLLIVLGWVLAFFRDPQRKILCDEFTLVSPADGLVSDVGVVDDVRFEGGKAFRVGIFLNIFNVHINRVPCGVRIGGVEYKKGKFKNAMDPESAKVNESNSVTMIRLDEPFDKLIVRQISGAIARRIVCGAKDGDELAAGERFGMIKFGSRTELYMPNREEIKCLVNIGDKVKAGLTKIVRCEL
ncbi:MAG: phosphatidylserine decarboxylase family protein [Planctomycetes bacterium]|nr:phosphatidylserine decarboxylase family protein [Planctomycetota bacterium]